MTPREKHLALLSALCLVSLTFYYIPTFFYATLFLGVCCSLVNYYHSGVPLPAGLLGLSAAGLRRWLSGWRWTGVSAVARRTASSGRNKAALRDSKGGHFREERLPVGGIYRRETLASESFLFSPRDFLMGSYIGKPETPTAGTGRPRAVGRNPREVLREKLARPNHAVYTPNRRLSFTGEPLGTMSRFTITPQRHYPLQQPGVSSLGVLPPVKWDGFRKKNVLSPRNSATAFSPVTVKIARPDHHHGSPSLEHPSCAGLPRAPVDPCSRESVLKVLKESRKREVEDEERSFTTDQRSKRRRNDSGGSSHSAFGSRLPNGTPSQLVPKPGTLKRGMLSLAEESIMKRSRTSSISSASGPHGTPGSRRNPINSSYSSSKGLSQWKKRSAPSSPLSSPGSSRPQTPEGAPKRAREDDGQSPSSASSVRSEHTASDKAPVTSKSTPVPKLPVRTSTHSTGSGGKRKRKIQLVSSHRDDHISLPPPPELGYTITVKDLDEEKKAAISKIQKVLETPAPEPEKPVSPLVTASSQPASSTITTLTTLSSLLGAPLPTASGPAIPVINLDPTPVSSSVSTTPAAPNPLLEALKKSSTPVSLPSPATTTTVSASSTPVEPSGLNLKFPTAVNAPQLPPVSSAPPSAFTQVLAQVSKASSSVPPAAAAAAPSGLFGPTPAASSSSNTVTATAPASGSTSNPLLPSGFKPIFDVTTTNSPSATSIAESKAPVPSFKPIFGAATTGTGFGQPSSVATTIPASTAASSSSSAPSTFGGLTSSTAVAPSMFPGLTSAPAVTTPSTTATEPAVKSLFGAFGAPSTTSSSSAPAQPANTGSTFQFGAATMTTAAAPAAATTTPSNGAFAFGATQPTNSGPQAANQKVFAFGQAAPAQGTTPAPFGGFGMANTAPNTTTTNTAASAAAATTQSNFSFGQSSFPAPSTAAPQTNFSTSAAGAKPFAFGNSGASSTPASNQAPTPFPFGAAAVTTSTGFGAAAVTTATGFGAAAVTTATGFGAAAVTTATGFGAAAVTTATGFGTPAVTTATGFGAPAVTTATGFGTSAKPAFGSGSSGFAFGGPAAPAPAAPLAAPSFGGGTQTQSSTNTFTFGSAAPQQAAGPAPPAQSGFNFSAAGIPCPQFGTPVASNPTPQMGGFNFGAAATDKPAFGTSTPTFGQSAAAAGPIPFGSPATPVQGFNAVPFGSPATPSFSIGAGSKPSGARQRLQARRQHNRKK